MRALLRAVISGKSTSIHSVGGVVPADWCSAHWRKYVVSMPAGGGGAGGKAQQQWALEALAQDGQKRTRAQGNHLAPTVALPTRERSEAAQDEIHRGDARKVAAVDEGGAAHGLANHLEHKGVRVVALADRRGLAHGSVVRCFRYPGVGHLGLCGGAAGECALRRWGLLVASPHQYEFAAPI